MKTKIAPGHNPDKLTVEQVGNGWRLLTLPEKKARAKKCAPNCVREIQCYSSIHRMWHKGLLYGASETITYRTRKPKGYWLTH